MLIGARQQLLHCRTYSIKMIKIAPTRGPPSQTLHPAPWVHGTDLDWTQHSLPLCVAHAHINKLIHVYFRVQDLTLLQMVTQSKCPQY